MLKALYYLIARNYSQEIGCELSEVVLTGGTENMSMAPHVLRGARFGVKLGLDLTVKYNLEYSLMSCNA